MTIKVDRGGYTRLAEYVLLTVGLHNGCF